MLRLAEYRFIYKKIDNARPENMSRIYLFGCCHDILKMFDFWAHLLLSLNLIINCNCSQLMKFKVISIQQVEHCKFLDCKIPLYAIHRKSHPSMMPLALADHQKHLNIQRSAFDIVQPL